MSSQWLGQHGAKPPNAGEIPVVTSILKDFSAEALGELRTWLEQNPPAISVKSIIGYNTNTVRIYKKATAAVTVASSTAETPVLTETIPAGTMGTTGMVRVSMENGYLNSTGSNQVFTIRVKFGGTSFMGHAVTSNTNANQYPANLEFTIANLGATNSNFMRGVWYPPNVGGGSPGSVAGLLGTGSTFPFTSTGAQTIDTTVDQDIVVTVQHGASSASLSFTRQHYMVEFL